MVKFVQNALEALHLSEFSRVCRDPDRLRETALALLHDRRGRNAPEAGPTEGEDALHRLAA